VGPEEAFPVRSQPCGDLRNRQAGGVGGKHGMGRKMGHNARQQGRLDGQILGHGLYHPVALGQLRQVVVEVAGRDERGQCWLIEGGRLGLPRASIAASASRLRGPSPAGTISSSSVGMPALARWAAMREPMVPAPSTAARRTRNG
jgi:hypothetical protein